MTQKKPAEELSEQLSSLLNDPETIKEAADQAAETVANYIRKHPYQSIGITFATGLLAGLFLSKKNKS